MGLTQPPSTCFYPLSACLGFGSASSPALILGPPLPVLLVLRTVDSETTRVLPDPACRLGLPILHNHVSRCLVISLSSVCLSSITFIYVIYLPIIYYLYLCIYLSIYLSIIYLSSFLSISYWFCVSRIIHTSKN